jgi:glycerate kinase
MTSTTAPRPVRALIAPDKFKGSLTAAEVADALAAGLRSAANVSRTAGAVQCELLPLADGGDGSVDAAVAAGFTRHSYTVAGPTGQPVQAAIAFDGNTAVVEVANTSGLALLPEGKLEPLNTSSRRFGEAVLLALSLKPARIVLALGGSASTDGGMGMLTALGYRFLDVNGRQLDGNGRTLGQIHSIQRTDFPELAVTKLIVASDVHNPLLGPQGAPAVFGPQKGAGSTEIAALDDGLAHLVRKLSEAGIPRPRPWLSTKGPEAPEDSATHACCWGQSRCQVPITSLTCWISTPARTAATSSSPAKAASTNRPWPASFPPPLRAARAAARSSRWPGAPCSPRSAGPKCR